MNWADSAHTRLVGTLKVVLPLLALALLSTLFLLSRGREGGQVLPYAEIDLEAMLREPRMTAPEYVGVTSDGAAITLTAAAARPMAGSEDGARADLPDLLLVAEDGTETHVAAQEARVDPQNKLMILQGNVVITTSDGYRIESARITGALDRSRIESPGPVQAKGPEGQIEAGSMVLERGTERGADVLVFNGGAKLIYRPADASPSP